MIKKKSITESQLEQLRQEAKSANLLLNGRQFFFFMDFLKQAQSDIERMILNNTVRDVSDEHTMTDNFKKIFFTPKKEQIDELSGRYKMLREIVELLENRIKHRKELETLINDNKVIVNEN